jgi:AMMECR1 domain-containing protein
MKTYSLEQIGYLIRVARRELALSFGKPLSELGPDPGGWDPGFVNISLRCRGLLCGSMGAGAADLPEATRAALRRAALDERFNRVVLSADVDSTVIELWIETESHVLQGDPDFVCENIRLGRDGVKIQLGENKAYYKASVAITKSVSTPQQLLQNLCRKAGLMDSAWRDNPQARIERTSWIHAMESREENSGVVLLEGLRRVNRRKASPDEIRTAARLSAARMLAIQKSDGSLGYLYDPFRDEWDKGENRVRAAGCAYALARAAQHIPCLGLPGLSGGADRALRFLMARTHMTLSENSKFVSETDSGEPWGKLGATALTALGAEYAAGDGWREESRQLVNTMLGLQNPDGSFRCWIRRQGQRAGDQNFFPGECLLALSWYAHRTGDASVANAIGRSFRYYVEHFRREPASAFVLWQADAWSRVAGWMSEGSFPSLGPEGPEIPAICQFVFEQVDWMLLFQHTEQRGSPREYWGGFKFPNPPTYSTTTYVEAIIRACDVASLVSDAARVKSYRAAALQGLEFSLHLQVLPESEAFFPQPLLAVGGSTESIESFKMRCDFDQHFLTACLTALDTSSLWE